MRDASGGVKSRSLMSDLIAMKVPFLNRKAPLLCLLQRKFEIVRTKRTGGELWSSSAYGRKYGTSCGISCSKARFEGTELKFEAAINEEEVH
ncbi:hypothetical protein HAX54_035488 [Datura stramonium]|uniref:Uncharacterized protein n=1 Tax=Datura stramonium TaxID=4076 RepID=A0ABS8VFC2_DATST|nr:hypothetical protein [Datura stramonium]